MTSKRLHSDEAGLFFIASIIIAQGLWSFFFQLGAYDNISYDHIFVILCASIAALLASLIIRKTEDGQPYFSITGTVILILPSLWFCYEVLMQDNQEWSTLRIILTLSVVTLSAPYVIYLLLLSVMPDFSEIAHIRSLVSLVMIGVVISSIAYSAGFWNGYIMSCDDFNSVTPPKNCYSSNVSQKAFNGPIDTDP